MRIIFCFIALLLHLPAHLFAQADFSAAQPPRAADQNPFFYATGVEQKKNYYEDVVKVVRIYFKKGPQFLNSSTYMRILHHQDGTISVDTTNYDWSDQERSGAYLLNGRLKKMARVKIEARSQSWFEWPSNRGLSKLLLADQDILVEQPYNEFFDRLTNYFGTNTSVSLF